MTMMSDYITVPPYAHQQTAFERAVTHYENGGRGYALFMEVGTGKTLPALALIGHLYGIGKISKALIVCPLAVFTAWINDFKHLDVSGELHVLKGTSNQKIRTLNYLKQASGLQILLTNYESVRSLGGCIIDWSPDMIICDESQKIKTHNSQQSKALHHLGDRAKYKLILTGTPVGNSPIDFWSQYRFLDKSIFGGSYYSFLARYAEMSTEVTHSGQRYKKLIGYHHLSELVDKAHSIAYRVKKADCLDLPEQTNEYRLIDLETQAQKQYNSLKNNSVAELSKTEVVTTRQVITKLLRLSQFCGGFLGGIESLDGMSERTIEQVSRAKLNALKDLLEDEIASDKKVVIFARFRPEINAIRQILGTTPHVVMTGDTTADERIAAVNAFQNDPKIKAFVANPQCAGAGITLTAADTMIFYSLSYSYLEYEQARARIHRIGQKNTCTYIHLLINNSIDQTVLAALEAKKDIAKLVVDNVKILETGEIQQWN